ncbi:hypothetical protein [Aureliella helgolandensis]|uniref:Uncharacterized protein n=1 Tax=Aureliella helgolandensis TaxID=2527968 RepID=A0A518G885_9BACT|nr:hypothetical protein [Aureliella helgolandensis]QDV24797.1 hypothetical protein Q31a_31190 [Aureliella helgolandensis]
MSAESKITSSTPADHNCGSFRGEKHTIGEGGVRLPLIVRWPQAIMQKTEFSQRVHILKAIAKLQLVVGPDLLDSHTATANSDNFSAKLFANATHHSRRATMIGNSSVAVGAVKASVRP